ncbi:MAG: DUF3300 domain-containing protein [Alcaligenaceae bacterium]
MSRQKYWSVCVGASWLLASSGWAQVPATPVPVTQSAAPVMTPLAQTPVQPANLTLLPQTAAQPANQPSGQANIVSLPELQALVAPVALYPDALLAQMLMAATYPLEVAAATIWFQNNRLTGNAFEAELAQQRWDNSVKSLVHFPEALKLLGNQLEWTHRLGDAYLVQPSELMQAIQALRSHARQTGNLQSGTQMVVSNDPLSNIIIMPTNPDIVYVPTYNPMVVYGPWPYPAYQPYAVYNPVWGAMAFGVGVGVGVALWATPYWGYGSIYINNGYYNRFNALYNAPGYRYPARVGGASYWAYNGAHRYNVPYQYPNRGITPAAQQHSNQARQHAQQYTQNHGGGAAAVHAAGASTGALPATTARPSGGRSSTRRY